MARRRQHSMGSFSDINITPLMDLTFLLLIVFMITAPMMEFSVDVSPPKMDAQPLDDPTNLMISLHADGSVVLDGKRMEMDELYGRLATEFQSRPDAMVLIRGHEERPYKEVIALMRVAYKAGFGNVSLVTVAEDKG